MADSLVLKGVKDVRKHTGTEMQLLRPKHGGDTFHLREWWRKGRKAIYCDCTVFQVTTAAGSIKLALNTNMSSDVRIDHDGAFNFKFYGVNEISRAALFTEDWSLIEHYAFAPISGGPVMMIIPEEPSPRPGEGTSWLDELAVNHPIYHIKNINGGAVNVIRAEAVYSLNGDLIEDNPEYFQLADGMSGESEFIIVDKLDNNVEGYFGQFASSSADWEFGELTNTSLETDFALFCEQCSKFTGVGIEYIDTSNVNTLMSVFYYCPEFNGDITGWNTAKVTHFNGTLNYASKFDQDLSLWCTSSVETFSDFASLSLIAGTPKMPVWGTCPRGEDQA